jgi:hypothetical protein
MISLISRNSTGKMPKLLGRTSWSEFEPVISKLCEFNFNRLSLHLRQKKLIIIYDIYTCINWNCTLGIMINKIKLSLWETNWAYIYVNCSGASLVFTCHTFNSFDKKRRGQYSKSGRI